MIKVAIVGTAATVQEHIEAWPALNNAEVIGVVHSGRGGVGKEVETGGIPIFSNLAELSSQADVDVVDFCVQDSLDPDDVKQASGEVKHVVCQVPLTIEYEEYETLKNISKENNVHLYLGDTLRGSPEYADARKRVKEGAIGTPGIVRLNRRCPYPAESHSGDGGQDKRGIFTYLGIREFDWLTWTFGDAERVMAKKVTHSQGNENRLEYALITLRMEDGTIAHVELSTFGDASETSFELTGDKGMISHNSQDSSPVRLQTAEPAGVKVSGRGAPVCIPEKKLYQPVFQNFVDIVSSGERLPETEHDILKAIEIARACAQSAESGQPVELIKRGDL